MHIVLGFVAVGVVSFALGYAFRRKVHKAIVAVAEVGSDAKAEVKAVEGDVKKVL